MMASLIVHAAPSTAAVASRTGNAVATEGAASGGEGSPSACAMLLLVARPVGTWLLVRSGAWLVGDDKVAPLPTSGAAEAMCSAAAVWPMCARKVAPSDGRTQQGKEKEETWVNVSQVLIRLE